MDENSARPMYPIGIVSEIIGLHQRTLRAYEHHGLIRPVRRGGKRFYSNNDLRWLECVRRLIADEGLDIAGVKKLLAGDPCWDIRKCPDDRKKNCPAILAIPLPCWEIQDRCGSSEGRCAQCEVYARKTNHATGLACPESSRRS
ncbi:MAG: MerR family transcriptional regulator [Desulfobacteraceae bacterium]|nr:MerR family transcriptional regulator [Desulfobacteraceae bacterium]